MCIYYDNAAAMYAMTVCRWEIVLSFYLRLNMFGHYIVLRDHEMQSLQY